MNLLGALDYQLAAFWIASIASIVFLLKRRYGSSLRHIPGPFFASFSKAWQIYHVIKGDTEKVILELHKQYGQYITF